MAFLMPTIRGVLLVEPHDLPETPSGPCRIRTWSDLPDPSEVVGLGPAFPGAVCSL